MKDKEKNLMILCSLFFGIILGFCIAPIKKGMSVEIKNNGNRLKESEDDII